MLLKQLIEIYDILDAPDASGALAAAWLKSINPEAEVKVWPLEGPKGVTDMIRIDYFGKELFGSTFFPIFNVADISLVVGGILLIVYVLFFYYDKKNPEEVKKHEEKMEKKAQKRAERKAKKLCKDVESVEDFLARTEVDAATATEEENGGV